jgi:hypothetical protein
MAVGSSVGVGLDGSVTAVGVGPGAADAVSTGRLITHAASATTKKAATITNEIACVRKIMLGRDFTLIVGLLALQRSCSFYNVPCPCYAGVTMVSQFGNNVLSF